MLLWAATGIDWEAGAHPQLLVGNRMHPHQPSVCAPGQSRPRAAAKLDMSGVPLLDTDAITPRMPAAPASLASTT